MFFNEFEFVDGDSDDRNAKIREFSSKLKIVISSEISSCEIGKCRPIIWTLNESTPIHPTHLSIASSHLLTQQNSINTKFLSVVFTSRYRKPFAIEKDSTWRQFIASFKSASAFVRNKLFRGKHRTLESSNASLIRFSKTLLSQNVFAGLRTSQYRWLLSPALNCARTTVFWITSYLIVERT